jgi:hypothetical protein
MPLVKDDLVQMHLQYVDDKEANRQGISEGAHNFCSEGRSCAAEGRH